jgi:nucleoside-diphosphate-sugar epimerase
MPVSEIAQCHIKELVYIPIIDKLPAFLESIMGLERLVCFSSTSLESKAASQNKRERRMVARMVQAEKDVQVLCDRKHIKWTIFRPTLIYGLGLDQNIARIVNFIEKFGVFFVAYSGKGLRQPVHADDLAHAAVKVLGEPKTFGHVYNLSGNEVMSYKELVSSIFRHQKKKPIIINLPLLACALDWLAKLTGRRKINGEIARRMKKDLTFSHAKAQEDFGFTPRSLDLSRY